MKNNYFYGPKFIFLLFVFFKFLFPQGNTEWLNFANTDKVTCIRTENEKVWIGTFGGLICIDTISGQVIYYNGSNSNLPGNKINAIGIDSYGNKWIGTSAGLAKFNDTDWQVYTSSNSDLTTDYILHIAVDSDDGIWLGTVQGLFKFSNDEFEIYDTSNSGLPGNYISALAIDGNDNLWMSAYKSDYPMGLIFFDRNTWEIYNIENSEIPGNYFYCLSVMNKNKIIIGGYGILSIFDGNAWANYNSDNCNIPETSILSICQDGDQLWIGTYDGVYKFDLMSNFNYVTHKSHLITSLNNDYKKKVYIGTYSGLSVYDGANTENINISYCGIADNTVKTLSLERKNKIWIGTRYGLDTYDDLNWTHINKLPSENVLSSAIDGNGTKWIGTDAGLVKIVNNTYTVFNKDNSELPNDEIYAITLGKNGDVWLGTGRQIVKINGSNFTVYDPPNSYKSMVNQEVSIVIDKDNNLWMARIDAGIVKYNGQNWTLYNTFNSGLPDENIYSMAQDSSRNIWIGSNAGLTRFKDGNWTTFNPSNSGLPSIYVNSIIVDKNDHLWIGTHMGGLVYYDKKNWITYNTMSSGLSSNTIFQLLLDENENLWIGTFEGGLDVYKEGGIVSLKDNKKGHFPDTDFLLIQNYPNPFNPVTTIEYYISKPSLVNITVYNILGEVVESFNQGFQNSGNYKIKFDGKNFTSGIYYYTIKAGSFFKTKSMLLIK